MMKVRATYHTDELLRKHGLLVEQVGDDPQEAEYSYVDWQTFAPVSARSKRARAYEREVDAERRERVRREWSL
jgi:hypothetical protein